MRGFTSWGLTIATLAAAVLGSAGAAEADGPRNLQIAFKAPGVQAKVARKAESRASAQFSAGQRQGILNNRTLWNARTLSEDGEPAPIYITIVITGRDSPDDEDHDADQYDVHLLLNDDEDTEYELDVQEDDTERDVDGSELLTHVDHVIGRALEYMTEHNE